MIVGAIAEVLTLIAARATLKTRPALWYTVPILALISALCLLIAIIVYAVNYTDYDGRRIAAVAVAVTDATNQRPVAAVAKAGEVYASNYLSWSFWLAVISFILMLLATIIAFVAGRKHQVDRRRKHEVTLHPQQEPNVARVVVHRDVRYEATDAPRDTNVRRY